MHELIETVLTVSTWFSENDWADINSFIVSDSIFGYGFTIAFHVTLLDMSWESQKSLAIWEDGSGSVTTGMRVIESHHSEEDWNVLGDIFFGGKVLINVVHTTKEFFNIIKSVVEGKWKNTDS